MRNSLLTLLIAITVATVVSAERVAANPTEVPRTQSPHVGPVPAPLFTAPPVVSSLTLVADQTGPLSCPNMFKVRGTVAGTPGAQFTYSIDTHFNGLDYHQVVGKSFTMPASGTIDAPFQVDVPQLGPSDNYVDVKVTPAGGTTKETKFPVTCAGISMAGFTFINEERAGSQWRPQPGIHYALEDLQGQVRLQLPGPATGAPDCGFNLVVKTPLGQTLNWQTNGPGPVSQANGHYYVTDKVDFHPPTSGTYHMTAVGQSQASGQPACVNAGNLGSIDFLIFPPTAWVMGFTLKGFAYHFAGGTSGDAISDQWCHDCETIFSPGHNEGFMELEPDIQGSSNPSYPLPHFAGQCSYLITFNGGSFDGNNTMNLGQGLETFFINGRPAVPANQTSLFNGFNPWFSEWNGSTNTAQVTISPSIHDPLFPPCNISGGSITKTITFTNNPNAPTVTK
jgi:hypothetical protein